MKHSYDLVNSFLKMKSVSHFSNLLKHVLQFTSTQAGLITSLKLKEGNSASKRPLSNDNTSWTVNYFNYSHYHVFFLSFPFSFKRARKLLTTPWKAQDIPAPIHIEWIATSRFPFPWE